MSRVIYKKNPLIEVIIQYRFPKILALNNVDPVDFQDAIREDYPVYQLSLENQHELTFPFNPENLALSTLIQKQTSRNHNFISQDGQYKVNLTSTFISVSTIHYTRWEDLHDRFTKVVNAFEKVYRPSFYERIGLRYIDAYSRNKLNLLDKSWSDLINQPWVGAFSSIEETKVLVSGLDVEYRLDNDISAAKIHTGTGNVNNSTEKVFIIDSDFFHYHNIKLDMADDILNYLHDNAKKFIESAVKETLHKAMEPEETL